MNIGRKKIQTAEYAAFLQRLIANLEKVPVCGVQIYNIIYDLISSKPSYEAQLYHDLCRFLHGKIQRRSGYLQDFGEYKRLALALSGLCSLLHDTLGPRYRRIDEMAFLIWERLMLRGKDLGKWLVEEIKSEITAQSLFGYEGADISEVSRTCRNICFEVHEPFLTQTLEVLHREEAEILADIDRDTLIRRSPESKKRSNTGCWSDVVNTGAHNTKWDAVVANSDGFFGPEFDFDNEKGANVFFENADQSLQSPDPIGSQCNPFDITYLNIRDYLDMLKYIVPDAGSPMLYYTGTYELKALTKIAYESTLDNVSFEEYSTFSYLKLASELKRMEAIFLEPSYAKVLKTLDSVIVRRKKEWLKEMFKTVIDEPRLLRRYFSRFKLFPSFQDVFRDVFECYLNDFIRERVKGDLRVMHDVLQRLVKYTEAYLAPEWTDFVKLVFARHLNEIRAIAEVFVRFSNQILNGYVNSVPEKSISYEFFDGLLCAAPSLCQSSDGGCLADVAPQKCALSSDRDTFNSLFAFLNPKCEFSELYAQFLQDRLLNNPHLLVEKAFLTTLIEKGCSTDFKRKIETMLQDVEDTNEYAFSIAGRFLKCLGCSAGAGVSHNRDFADIVDSDTLTKTPKVTRGARKGTDPQHSQRPESTEHIVVRPYVLSSGTWSFHTHTMSLPLALVYVLTFFESKFKLGHSRRYFNWVYSKSIMIIELGLKRTVTVELSTLQYCVLDSLREKNTIDEIVKACGCEKRCVEEVLDVLVKSGLVVSTLSTKDGKTESAEHVTNSERLYFINMDFDRPTLKLAENAKHVEPKKVVDTKQIYQSVVCRLMKREKSLTYADIIKDIKDVDKDVFDGVLGDCINQGYMEKEGDVYFYVS